MARRRHRSNSYPKIEITFLKDGTKEIAELAGTSKSGKSIRIIRNGKPGYIALDRIEYRNL